MELFLEWQTFHYCIQRFPHKAENEYNAINVAATMSAAGVKCKPKDFLLDWWPYREKKFQSIDEMKRAMGFNV